MEKKEINAGPLSPADTTNGSNGKNSTSAVENSNMISTATANDAVCNDKVESRFNPNYTPMSVKVDESGYHEFYKSYSISEMVGRKGVVEVHGNPLSYKWWFRDLAKSHEAMVLRKSLRFIHLDNGSMYDVANLQSFREFLVRYMNDEFMVTRERNGNCGPHPKPKFFEQLPQLHQNNIFRMIDAIDEAVDYITNAA